MSEKKIGKRRWSHRKKIAVKAFSVLLTLAFLVLLVAYLYNLFLGDDKITAFFQSYTKTNPALCYVLFLVLTPLINIVPGISSMFTIALANMLFNYGTLRDMFITFGLCAASVVLTSTLMFLIGRLGGKRVVEWIAGKEEIDKVQRYLTIGGKAVVPMMYALPFFPDDTISLIAGMTEMSFLYNFVCTLIFRNFGVFAMCFFGTDFFDYKSFTWKMWLSAIAILLALFLILAFLSFLYYRHLRRKEDGIKYDLIAFLHPKKAVELKKAHRKQLPLVLSMYEEARKKRARLGLKDGEAVFPKDLSLLKADCDDGILYILYREKKAVATLVLSRGEDEPLEDGRFAPAEDYVVLQRVVGLSKDAAFLALRDAKSLAPAIRTAVSDADERMKALLERSGFVSVGPLENGIQAYEHVSERKG